MKTILPLRLLLLLLSLSLPAGEKEILEQLGGTKDKDGNILLGEAFLRKSDRTISFPGRLNIRSGVIEVLVSTPRGRVHESLVVTDLDPFLLQAALILAGYRNGSLKNGSAFSVEIAFGGKRVPAEEWLYDNTAKKPKRKGCYIFVGSSFQDRKCLASLEGNLININSLDKNTILTSALSGEEARHEYVVDEKKMPPMRLKDPAVPLAGYEDVPVRVILVPVSPDSVPADGRPGVNVP